MGVKVVFIRSNSLATEPRILNETVSLAKNNYNVIILAWDRENSYSPLEVMNHGVSIKRFKLPAPYGKITICLLLPIFWLWLISELLILKPKVVHACDLDTAIPAYMYKVLKRKLFVFDVFDRYAMAYVPKEYNILYFTVSTIEELLASKADLFITVSERFLETFNRFRIKKPIIIRNTPRKEDIKRARSKKRYEYRQTFRGYISNIGKEALLVFKAIRGNPNIELLITGNVDRHIAELMLSSPQVKYLGIIPYEEVLNVENSVDAILILYDPSIELSQFRIAGSYRLFEAMMLRKVVITNIYDKYVFEKMQCCILVDYEEESIKKAITFLMQNPEERKRLSLAGSLLSEEKYSWEAMEKLLIDSYTSFITKKNAGIFSRNE